MSTETIIIITITVLSCDDKQIETEICLLCYEKSLYQQFYVMLYEFILNLNLTNYKHWLCVIKVMINTSRWFNKNQSTRVAYDHIKTQNGRTNHKFSKQNLLEQIKKHVEKDIKINRIYSMLFLFSINTV